MGQGAKATVLTPDLCRGARGLIGWTQSDLAERASVSRGTIRDYEGHHHEIHRATEAQLRHAFEEEGVRFVKIDGYGTGICRILTGENDSVESQTR